MSRRITDRLDDLQLSTIRALRATELMKVDNEVTAGLAYDSALHHFSIASESLSQLKKKIDLSEFSQKIQYIIDLRNAATHEYFRVDGDEIIASIKDELVPLVEAISDEIDRIRRESVM